MLFVPGLVALALYCPDGSSMRAVVAATIVCMVSWAGFWIGYHRGAQYRGFGGPGMPQSMLVLVYVSARFGYDMAGLGGALAPLVLFGCIEAYLLCATRPSPLDLETHGTER